MLKKTIIFAAIAGLVFALAPAAQAMEFVTVGNPGNPADTEVMTTDGTTGYGAVAYTYNIGKYEVTNTQYAEFLTAVVGAGTDTYALYNGSMQITVAAGGVYTATVGNENKPVEYTCWYDAIRFANWMTAGATETGSYTITGGGANSGTVAIPDASQRTAWAAAGDRHVLLPSEDEWYKAAYYDGAAYWDYPNGSNTAPTPTTPAAQLSVSPGSANYAYAVGATTDVGAYSAWPTDSPYGTYDQGGNVWEWNEALIGSNRGIRGGGFSVNDNALRASHRRVDSDPTDEEYELGFRVAEIPEPATLALLGLGGLGVLLRRKLR